MFKQIHNLKIKTVGAIIALLVIIIGIIVFSSSVLTIRETEKISANWEKFNNGPALKYVHLNALRRAIGYGGVIHNLKNYILRGNRKRIIAIQRQLREARIYLIAYRKIDTSPKEKKAITDIERTLQAYAKMVGIAEKMFIEGKSARQIDLKIKIDDAPALRDIQILENAIESARQNLSRAVDESVASTKSFVIRYSFVTGLLLFFLIIDGLWFTRTRLSLPITRLARIMARLAAGDTSVDITGIAQKNEIGDMARAVQVFKENVIKRERAELALQQSEAKFHNLVEYAADAIFVNDFNGKFVDVNQKACEALGYDREELLTLGVSDITTDKLTSHNRNMLKEKPVGEAITVENIHLRKDKTTFPVEVRIGKIEVDGEEFIVALARDITRRKESESRLLEAKYEAEAASRAKSEFLSNMSHELRTPLNAIVGFSDILIRDMKDPLGCTLIPKIRESGLFLTNLIEDILDLERIEAGKTCLEVRQVNINNLVNKVAESWHPRLSDKCPLSLELDTAAGSVPCDAVRVRQILTNILDNAAKYSPGGGEISVRTHSYPDEIWVSVEDHGIGMDSGEMQGIFERFNQLESGYQRRSGGLGIGLSLIRELVEMHDGRIWAESEKGRGSTFIFALPRAAAALSPGEGSNGESAAPGLWKGKSVLVVDDIEHYHEYMKLLMEDASAIHSAYNGEEAVEIARRERPCIILMDLRMPVMNGFEAIEALKADPKTREIPILAVTAQAMARDRNRVLDLGAEGFVTKPINLNALEEAFQQALDKQNAPSNVA